MHVPGVMAFAIIFLIYLASYLQFVNLTISRTMEIAFFPLCLLITYINFIEIKKEKTFDQIIDIQFYYLIVVAIAFFIAQVQRRGEFKNNVNTVYYVIFSLPFILQQKNRTKRTVGLALILGCLFFSLKRTPFLVVGLTLIFHNKNKVSTLKALRKGILVLLALLAIDYFFAAFLDIHMLDRLMALADDGGSGRVDLLKETMELLNQSSFWELFFGHALRHTGSVFELGAHNDFLEVLYRMGALGFLLFLGYFIGIIVKISFFTQVHDYENAAMLKATLIAFVLVSFSSQLIFLPTYVGLVAMSISFALARNRFYQFRLQY